MNAPIILAVALTTFSIACAEDSPKAPQPGEAKPADAKPAAEALKPVAPLDGASAEEKKNPQEELEAKFKKTLTNATLSGHWSMVRDGKVSDPKEEKYTITGANKVFGERWLITARVQYLKNDYTAPFLVRVKWAGDTPVITVDDVGVPGGAKYSARVMIYDGTYAGRWSGGEHGGLMSGVIINTKE
jgi:hypothetical protein